MLNIDLQKKLPLPARSLAILFMGIVFVLLAIFMPPDKADAGGNNVGDGYVFPLPSKHEYGDGFGAGRGHDGQDLFANCGRKLVAANDGKIQRSEMDGSGYGNIVVLDVKGVEIDLLYAHMKKRDRQGRRQGQRRRQGRRGRRHRQRDRLPPPLRDAQGRLLEGGHAMRNVTKYLKDWDKRS